VGKSPAFPSSSKHAIYSNRSRARPPISDSGLLNFALFPRYLTQIPVSPVPGGYSEKASDLPFNRFLFTSKVAAGTAGASNHRN